MLLTLCSLTGPFITLSMAVINSPLCRTESVPVNPELIIDLLPLLLYMNAAGAIHFTPVLLAWELLISIYQQ